MLGRHVYRVRPTAAGTWLVLKDGEAEPRGKTRTQPDAVAQAERLAAADEPSRLIVESEDGVIADERLFGKDDAALLDEERSGAG